MTAAAELAGLPRASPDAPVESDPARIPESIAGPLAAGITARPATDVADEELAPLQAADPGRLHRQSGTLRSSNGAAVAEVTGLVVTRRVPATAWPLLGTGPDGTLRPGRLLVRLGRASRGHGVRRRLLAVQLTSGRADAGRRQALRSAALPRAGDAAPVALVEDRVHEGFPSGASLTWTAP